MQLFPPFIGCYNTPNKRERKLHLVGIYMTSITKMHGTMNIKKKLKRGCLDAAIMSTANNCVVYFNCTSTVIMILKIITFNVRNNNFNHMWNF